ncbi:MAG: ABC transporter ATP-binding protein [Methylococcales bacterium]|jgi:ABC-2 type transport system ATP-binding protein|nr:ABC transporter ATP-binding protein [Methylococcales bacterium]
MPPVLEVKNLYKVYGTKPAVNHIDFSIDENCCFGLLGPNGAGKTTTIEIIEGITKPTSGELFYMNHPIGAEFRQQAGIQFQNTALQDFLTVRETLILFHSLYQDTLPIEKLIEMCQLEEFLHQGVKNISGGQRQRLLLAIALANNPKILFLDEPTTGLDPSARRIFWDLINEIKKNKTAIVLTTHYMEEAYYLCDEIAIMDQGKIIAQGTPNSLLADYFDHVIIQIPKADFTLPIDHFNLPVFQQDESVEIHTDNVNMVIETLISNQISLNRLQIRSRTLEDLFIELTGSKLTS